LWLVLGKRFAMANRLTEGVVVNSYYYPECARAGGQVADIAAQRFVRSGRDLPVGLPASAYGPSLYWQVVYDKGASYFHELRQAVGHDAFLEILRAHYTQHHCGIATPESFLDVMESVTGDRYLDIFEEWIGQSGM
jgi:hypothetical protein